MYKEIIGYEWMYQINELWVVMSFVKRWKPEWHILASWIDRHGYPYYQFSKNWISKNISIHRLLATYFIPNPDNHKVVRHLDDNPSNYAISNLAWWTLKDNSRDMSTKWRWNFNYNHPRNQKSWWENVMAKKVWKYSIEWVLLKTWWSMKEARQELGMWKHASSAVCRNKKNLWDCYYSFL